MNEQQRSLQYSFEAEVAAVWREQLAWAAEKPWLASVLLKHGERILRRFVYFYQQLRSLSRRARRRMQRKLALGLGAAALLLALSSIQAPLAFADTITVDGTTCTLADAITAANTDTATGGCTAGSSADTLNITNDITLTAALPAITTEITIEGNGATIQRDGGAPEFRIFAVNGRDANNGDLTLNQATITGGNLADHGGGVYNCEGTVTINNSTISGNTATGGCNGGGVYSTEGAVTINNSTISDNTAAGAGGGVANLTGDDEGTGTVTINNSTISDNDAAVAGGGVANLQMVGTAAVTISHSIVSGNTAGAGREVFNYDGTVTANDYNLFGHSGETDAEAFYGFAPTDPTDINATSDGGGTPTALAAILADLADNGGPTETHALVADSPAIDAVPNAQCNVATDQRGAPRPYPSAGNCDVGAYEYDSPTAVTLASFGAETAPRPGVLALITAAGAAIGTIVLGGLAAGWAALRRRDMLRRRAYHPDHPGQR